ncbi:hypothetical protein BDR22DRAFT_893191 [Usnea florida]
MAPQGLAYGGLGPTLLGVSWMEFSITTIIIVLRAYTKVKLVSRGGSWALFWAVCAWVLGVFNGVSLTVAAASGMGNHQNSLSNHDFSTALHWVWVGNATTLLSISFGKIAVVAFLLTIQGETYKVKRYMLYFLCTSTVGFDLSAVLLNLTTVLIIFLQCDPPRKLWHPELPGNCNIEAVNGIMGYVCGAYGAFVDLALAVYPVFLLYQLQISKRMKLGISTLMAAGVFSAICAIVKTVEVARVVDSTDRTYDLTPLALWGATEMWMVIIACSIPACWPLVTHLFQKKKSVSGNTKRNTYGPDNHGFFPLQGMGGSYHVSAEGHRAGDHEDLVLRHGIMMQKDLSIRLEV